MGLSEANQDRIRKMLTPEIEAGNGPKIAQHLPTVVENIYNRLPSGDYGRGDVRGFVLSLLDAGRSEEEAKPEAEAKPEGEVWVFTVEDLETGETVRIPLPVDTSSGIGLGLEETARIAATQAERLHGFTQGYSNPDDAKPYRASN
jgi:hypothetical protein